METLSLNEVNRVNLCDSKLDKSTLFYSSRHNKLTGVAAFERFIANTGSDLEDYFENEDKIKTWKNHAVIKEDEYTIINDNDVFINGYSICSVDDETNDCLHKKDNNHDRSKQDEITNELTDRNQVSNMSRSDNDEYNAEYLKQTSSPKYSIYVKDKHLVYDMNIKSERDDTDYEFEKVLPFENTSTPKENYEMEILAGRNNTTADDVFKLADKHRLDEEIVNREEPIQNKSKLRSLSWRIKRSFDDVSVQRKHVEQLRRNSMDELRSTELRNLDSELTRKYHKLSKASSVPIKAFLTSAMDCKTLAPLPLLFTNKDKPRSISEITLPTSFDLQMAGITNVTACNTIDKENGYTVTRDESFFEIENNYGECDHNSELQFSKFMYEMKTVLNGDISVDETLQSKLEILRDCAETCRFVSIFKQDICEHKLSKFISVLFVNVNEPKKTANGRYYIPGEDVEIIEDIYTHFIRETIIYDDEVETCTEDPYSFLDDEWIIIT